ncbi:MAG: helix-turn-helix domain-containing protein [Anaerovoracaceae bacterium]
MKKKPAMPHTTGERLAAIRSARNITKKDLGIQCGFPEASAGVRISQYETDQKRPRPKGLALLAELLGVDEAALHNVDTTDDELMFQILFDLEDRDLMEPQTAHGNMILALKQPESEMEALDRYRAYRNFLSDWKTTKEKLSVKDTDDLKTIEEKKTQYYLWKRSYAKNRSSGVLDYNLLLERKKELEQELATINRQLERFTGKTEKVK